MKKGNEKRKRKKEMKKKKGKRKHFYHVWLEIGRKRESKREISFIPFAKRRKMGKKEMYIHKKLNSIAAHF